jgi:hypothetical protein
MWKSMFLREKSLLIVKQEFWISYKVAPKAIPKGRAVPTSGWFQIGLLAIIVVRLKILLFGGQDFEISPV